MSSDYQLRVHQTDDLAMLAIAWTRVNVSIVLRLELLARATAMGHGAQLINN